MNKLKIRKDLIKYTENLKEIKRLKLSNSKVEQNITRDIKIIEEKIEKLKKELEE